MWCIEYLDKCYLLIWTKKKPPIDAKPILKFLSIYFSIFSTACTQFDSTEQTMILFGERFFAVVAHHVAVKNTHINLLCRFNRSPFEFNLPNICYPLIARFYTSCSLSFSAPFPSFFLPPVVHVIRFSYVPFFCSPSPPCLDSLYRCFASGCHRVIQMLLFRCTCIACKQHYITHLCTRAYFTIIQRLLCKH